MPRFKVVLSKIKPKYINPFRVLHVPIDSEVETINRIFELDLDSEDEARALFAAAKKDDIENVRGFELLSIFEIEA